MANGSKQLKTGLDNCAEAIEVCQAAGTVMAMQLAEVASALREFGRAIDEARKRAGMVDDKPAQDTAKN